MRRFAGEVSLYGNNGLKTMVILLFTCLTRCPVNMRRQ